MGEDDYLGTAPLWAMLRAVWSAPHRPRRRSLAERKWRLSAAALARTSPLMLGPRADDLELVFTGTEELADGSGDVWNLQHEWVALLGRADPDRPSWPQYHQSDDLLGVVGGLLLPDAYSAAVRVASEVAADPEGESDRRRNVVRELWGNPFRPSGWSKPERSAVADELALQCYTAGDWSRLPVLADALEDAGCDCEPLLAHLRGAGSHVRGCWALDLVLGLG